jgi:hypothetical protein
MLLCLSFQKVGGMGSVVSGMGLKASGQSLHVMIANVDVQECLYLK